MTLTAIQWLVPLAHGERRETRSPRIQHRAVLKRDKAVGGESRVA